MLVLLRKIFIRFFGSKKPKFFNPISPDYTSQDASDIIYNTLLSNKPCMISRMGNTEFSVVHFYREDLKGVLNKYMKYVIGEIDSLEWPERITYKIRHNAGFFPTEPWALEQFSELMIRDIQNIDVLASIIDLENKFPKELTGVKRIGFEDLNAYNHKIPWTMALEGKKVLVVHPFQKSIESQYKKRELLFENKMILPKFDLITYKPVQSITGNFKDLPYESWFKALEKMQQDIAAIDFDIALLGCGAYGLPLASFIKNTGKKAVHIGGAIQIHFAIKGRRWENEYNLTHLFNEHWVRPMKEEVPENYKDVENGCYW